VPELGGVDKEVLGVGVDGVGVDEVLEEEEGGGCREVVGVGVGDGDGDDAEDSFVDLGTSPLECNEDDGCGTGDVFEVWCVEDVAVVDELLVNLEGPAPTTGVGGTYEGVEVATGGEDPAPTAGSVVCFLVVTGD